MEEPLLRLVEVLETASPEVFAHLVRGRVAAGWLMLLVPLVPVVVLGTTFAALVRRDPGDDPVVVVTGFALAIAVVVAVLVMPAGAWTVLAPEAAALHQLLDVVR